MNSLFTDWYQAASIRPDAVELKSRWQSVLELKKNPALKPLSLVRIAFQLPGPNSSVKEEFALEVQRVDPTFNPRKADLEIAILAAAILYELITNDASAMVDEIALAVACINCQGILPWELPILQDLTKRALDYLGERAVVLRTPERLSFGKSGAHKLETALKEIEALLPNSPEKLKKPFDLINDALKAQSEKISRITYELRIQREESDILWWLMGRWSDELRRPYSEYQTAPAALIAGRELAILTTIIPGPRSAAAVLHQLLASTKARREGDVQTITLKEAVNALSREERKAFLGGYDTSAVLDLCPIYLAVKISLELPPGKTWVPAYQTASPLKVVERFPPLDLAMQTYQEFQLLRTNQHAK